MRPLEISRTLCAAVAPLQFASPVTHIYNPLDYARAPHEDYVARYAAGSKEILFLGMNPGPWGMAQTGVPFGDVALVRDWLRISGNVGKPPIENPARPILGFDCTRREVSGSRLWGWAMDHWGVPEVFFARCYVHNYCPLAFMEASGKNRTPDRLPPGERAPLFEACDHALRELVHSLRPRFVIGIGNFAAARIHAALPGAKLRTGAVPHPSPASPAANRGWAQAMDNALAKLGIPIP